MKSIVNFVDSLPAPVRVGLVAFGAYTAGKALITFVQGTVRSAQRAASDVTS